MPNSPLRSPPFVLLDDSRVSGKAGDSLLFSDPSSVIRADSFDDIPAALATLDEAVERGRYVAGYIAYEVGLSLEGKLLPRSKTQGIRAIDMAYCL